MHHQGKASLSLGPPKASRLLCRTPGDSDIPIRDAHCWSECRRQCKEGGRTHKEGKGSREIIFNSKPQL